jgi:hypothetical protein
VRHPIVLAGVGFGLLGSAFLVVETAREPVVSWDENGWTVLVGFGMLSLLTMVAANVAALRDRRQDTEEQHGSLPGVEPAKTGGLIVATLWPASVSAVLLALVTGYAATVVDIRGHDIVQIVDTALGVVMSGAVGVALARWIPNPFIAPLAAWGLIFASPSGSPSSWHVLLGYSWVESLDLALWRLVYTAGLTILFCSVALLRRTREGWVIVSGAAGVAIASVSAVLLVTGVCPVPGRCLF